MNARIALSALVLLFSVSSCASGAVDDGAVAVREVVDAGIDSGPDNGIGTSPSVQKAGFLPIPAIKPCGLWKGATYAEAVAKADMGYPPDMLQFTLTDGLGCIDLVLFRDAFYPHNSEVFYAEDGGWRRAE